MKNTEIIAKLKEIIEEDLEHELPEQLNESHQVYEDLGIDSIMVLQLLVYVEEAFNVAVPEEDVDPETFQTIGNLVAFIKQLQAETA
ncbi:phosphopantetheine-binding protein [Longirhabdus pacifica]|uniref:phosphopantetheine-binding protein n=1 Tax=Longirhabdus pacifica TaxID=2305227 RepID=UPI001008D9D4|nr:phosphopantetheine-binding protein [Longirhabdus pacifica]